MKRTMRLGFVVLFLPLGTGCLEQGEPVSREQAVDYFQAHRQHYEQIVVLVEQCRPRRVGATVGYFRVWADGSSSEGLHCGRANESIAPIVDALQRADAASVDYSTSDQPAPMSPESPMRSVSISPYSAGLGVSGSMIDFVYSFQPLMTPPADEGDVSSGVERRPVTPPPHQWWWERSY